MSSSSSSKEVVPKKPKKTETVSAAATNDIAAFQLAQLRPDDGKMDRETQRRSEDLERELLESNVYKVLELRERSMDREADRQKFEKKLQFRREQLKLKVPEQSSKDHEFRMRQLKANETIKCLNALETCFGAYGQKY